MPEGSKKVNKSVEQQHENIDVSAARKTKSIKRVATNPLFIAALFVVVGLSIIGVSRASTVRKSTRFGFSSANTQVTGTAAFQTDGSILFGQLPTPAPTPTPSPTPVTGTSLGQKWNATNTGLAGAGVSEASLKNSGGVTYDSSYGGTAGNPRVISGMNYTGTVTIEGSYITIKNCKSTLWTELDSGGNFISGTYAEFKIFGNNITIENCTLSSPAGYNIYNPVVIYSGAHHVTLIHNDISRGEDAMTTCGNDISIVENYIHDSTGITSHGHVDGIQVCGGINVTIARNRLTELEEYDAPINFGNWTSDVKNISIVDNFLDGGQELILVGEKTHLIQNTRVLRNVMGGHQNLNPQQSFGLYHPLANTDNRPIFETEAQLAANPNGILWPTTGADVNYWGESSDLTPNWNGKIVDPKLPGCFTMVCK